jgi:UDP-GlcNAc:undecaprenyl-phosphate GlcNAc-1-phosphate transferase
VQPLLNPYYFEAPIPMLVVCGLSIFFLFQLGSLARKVDLVDTPDSRKQHKLAVPVIGGLAIFVSIALSFLLFPFGLGEFEILLIQAGITKTIELLRRKLLNRQ